MSHTCPLRMESGVRRALMGAELAHHWVCPDPRDDSEARWAHVHLSR